MCSWVCAFRIPLRISHIYREDCGIDFLKGEAVDMAPEPFLSEEAGHIPYDTEIRGLQFLANQAQRETEATELHHETTMLINVDRYYARVYPQHATARLYYRELEEGANGLRRQESVLIT